MREREREKKKKKKQRDKEEKRTNESTRECENERVDECGWVGEGHRRE